jgi:cob(I)alamin adenosyltransferase
MVHLTKIYTKTGDGGETSLANGKRVPKHSPEIIAAGAIDEANSTIGMIGAEYYNDIIQRVQSDLFDIGAELSGATTIKITKSRVDYLENVIDDYNEFLEPLHSFVLPVGPLHHARAVVRRAELQIWWAENYMEINEFVLKYLNRLSDLLFVMARYYNIGNEAIWVPRNE